MASMSPFDIFKVPKQFALDEDQLEKKYFEIQKLIHPDRFANASANEKRVAEQWSTLVNDAYTALKDPVKRAKLLCEAGGLTINENSSSGIDEDFLIDQLSRNEAIGMAKESGNTAELERIKLAVKQDAAELIRQIGKAIDEDNDLPAASEAVKMFMFIKRQLKELD